VNWRAPHFESSDAHRKTCIGDTQQTKAGEPQISKRRNPVRATIPAAPAAVAQLNAGEPLAGRFTGASRGPSRPYSPSPSALRCSTAHGDGVSASTRDRANVAEGAEL